MDRALLLECGCRLSEDTVGTLRSRTIPLPGNRGSCMRRLTTILPLCLWLGAAACLPAERAAPPPLPTVSIPQPVPAGNGGLPVSVANHSTAAAKLPSQPVAAPAPPADVDGRLLIATTRLSPRAQSDLPSDYKLAWWSRGGIMPIPLPEDDRGVLDAAARPGGGGIVAILGGVSVVRAEDDGAAPNELLPTVDGAQPDHVASYLSVGWAGPDRVLVRETAPSGLSFVDASGQVRVPIGLNGLNPSASRDGQHLALGYSGTHNFYSIFVADQPFADAHKLTDGDVLEVAAAWSPDGLWLAYAAEVPGSGNLPQAWAVRVARIDGTSEQTVIASKPGISYSTLRWSPDGQRIAFTRHDDLAHVRQIGVVNHDGTDSLLLSDGVANDRVLDWVP